MDSKTIKERLQSGNTKTNYIITLYQLTSSCKEDTSPKTETSEYACVIKIRPQVYIIKSRDAPMDKSRFPIFRFFYYRYLQIPIADPIFLITLMLLTLQTAYYHIFSNTKDQIGDVFLQLLAIFHTCWWAFIGIQLACVQLSIKFWAFFTDTDTHFRRCYRPDTGCRSDYWCISD